MSAFSALHVIDRILIECAFRTARLSVYCSSPLGAAAWSVWATPPKLTLSPLSAFIQPPCVMSAEHPAVGGGRTQLFVAVPHGAAPLGPAQPEITSAAGSIGPE